jgi:phosphatidylglycerol---prolipoprotein diacylglyceryl transferase
VNSRGESSAATLTPAVQLGFPRFFTIAGYSVNSYKVFLAVGICVGTLVTALMADLFGLSPLRAGSAAMVSALAGVVGARIYHVVVHAPMYFTSGSPRALWNRDAGGLSVFGALITFIPASLATAALAGIPAGALFDDMAVGVLAGGFCIRLGCVFNGCCVGRETGSVFGVRLHDIRGVIKRRIPAQFLEMAWWLLGLAAFLVLWPSEIPTGSLALAVLAWYSAGRFVLEPMREEPDIVSGRVRINQLVAALLALGAGGALIAMLLS